AADRVPGHRVRLAGGTGRAARDPDHAARAVPRAAAGLDHRERLRLPGRDRGRRADRLPGWAPARGPGGDRRGHRRAGLLRLVPAGQLGVGRRVQPALRAGARGLRDPGPYPQKVLRVVSQPDQEVMPAALAEPTLPVRARWVALLALA